MSYKQPLSKNQAGVKLTRSDKGKPRLTRRDRDVLRQIGEGTAYCFDQLQGLLARHPDTQSKDPSCSSESRTRALIRRWEQLGLVEYRKILHDEPGWIWLTRKGLYHVGLSARFHEPSLANLEHLFWINETRALIEDTYGSAPGFTWESERQIRATREHTTTALVWREPNRGLFWGREIVQFMRGSSSLIAVRQQLVPSEQPSDDR